MKPLNLSLLIIKAAVCGLLLLVLKFDYICNCLIPPLRPEMSFCTEFCCKRVTTKHFCPVF